MNHLRSLLLWPRQVAQVRFASLVTQLCLALLLQEFGARFLESGEVCLLVWEARIQIKALGSAVTPVQ